MQVGPVRAEPGVGVTGDEGVRLAMKVTEFDTFSGTSGNPDAV
jgi:hypothetical protein